MKPNQWQWFTERLGQPAPCSLCRRPWPARQLREVWMTGTIVEIVSGSEIKPQTLAWVCPNCPG
jgi:hypothetical protein